MRKETGIGLFHFDEERFGMRSARTYIDSLETLREAETFCLEKDVAFLVARVATESIQIVQEMEKNSFRLMDTLVYYNRNLKTQSIPEDDCKILIRPIRQGEQDSIASIAKAIFQGYSGHYHADPFLDEGKCDEVYVDWAYRSCVDRNLTDEVLVAEHGGSIVGFATLRLNHSDEGEGILFGVSPSMQGRKIYRSFMIHGMHWCLSNKATKMIYSTQVTNIAVQKVLARLGFEMFESFYTLHKWYRQRRKVS